MNWGALNHTELKMFLYEPLSCPYGILLTKCINRLVPPSCNVNRHLKKKLKLKSKYWRVQFSHSSSPYLGKNVNIWQEWWICLPQPVNGLKAGVDISVQLLLFCCFTCHASKIENKCGHALVFYRCPQLSECWGWIRSQYWGMCLSPVLLTCSLIKQCLPNLKMIWMVNPSIFFIQLFLHSLSSWILKFPK